MPNDLAILSSCWTWGAACRPLPGQPISGDMHLIKPVTDGLLVAVVDGLGHGQEAVAASRTAVDVLAAYAEEPLVGLVKRCHSSLTRTRGVVLTLIRLQDRRGQLSWLGIGNVEALLWRAQKPGPTDFVAKSRDGQKQLADRVVLRSGIVGYQLPELRESTVPISPGDLLVIATDGIKAGFTNALPAGAVAQQQAERILDEHFKGTDDALVVVLRYVGMGHD
jgi:negative regulator of sigma-B (phosphoserine phosphatase)